jgi:hypothetical protein
MQDALSNEGRYKPQAARNTDPRQERMTPINLSYKKTRNESVEGEITTTEEVLVPPHIYSPISIIPSSEFSTGVASNLA